MIIIKAYCKTDNNKKKYSNSSLFTQVAISGTKEDYENDVLLNSVISSKDEETKERRVKNIKECQVSGYVSKRLLKEKDAEMLLNMRIGCNHRLCPYCNELRRRVYKGKLWSVVQQYKKPRFMTVSFKEVNELSQDYLKKCSKDFNLLQKYLKRGLHIKQGISLLNQAQKDGFVSDAIYKYMMYQYKNNKYISYSLGNYINILEIEFHAKGEEKERYRTLESGKRIKYPTGEYYDHDSWNVHFHLIWDGDFVQTFVLRHFLSKITKGKSFYVDTQKIRMSERINEISRALSYVTKYLSKMSCDLEQLDHKIMYYKQTKNIRFVKISGIKPLRSLNDKQYTLFTKYLTDQLGWDWEDAYSYAADIESFMNENELQSYNLEWSREENFFEYASSQRIIEVFI